MVADVSRQPDNNSKQCQGGTDGAARGAGLGACLKSRPNGWIPSFPGTKHRPGHLPHAPADIPLPHLPPASGRPLNGRPLPPPRLFPASATPPPWPEPLVPVTEATREEVAAAEASRSVEPGALINRLVYDAWLPSPTPCPAPDHPHYAPGLPAWYAPAGPQDTTLVFESRFESGNLRRAIQVREWEYDLVLQPDLNTRGHTQWYFFALSGAPPGVPLTFNLINLLKEDSLYSAGLLPLVHSEERLMEQGVGWVHEGGRVAYYPNSIKRGRRGHYHTLTFTLTLGGTRGDWVHLAHHYPYTFTDLQHSLAVMMASARVSSFTSRSVLATSLAGNPLDLITITAPADTPGALPLEQRRVVVLSSRVHPGESNASWMMAGALAFLTSTHQEAEALRANYVFKVVPMLNPDGVVVGNYRCSLAGLDLNRAYEEPGAPAAGGLVPGVAAYKALLAQLAEQQQLVLLVDFHGHSRKAGIFMYGCEKRPRDAVPAAPGWPVPGSRGGLPGVPPWHQERVFPALLAANVPHLFAYRACDFKVQRSKAGTGRVVSFRQLGLVNAFTLEASFGGGARGSGLEGHHFNTAHLEELGAAVVRTLADYWAPPEVSSVPDLLTALAAASRNPGGGAAGGTSSSSAASSNGGGGSGTEGAAPAAALPWLDLVLAPAGDEEGGDSATDSDDESSDPEATAGGAGRGPALSSQAAAAVRPAALAAAEAAAAALQLLLSAGASPPSADWGASLQLPSLQGAGHSAGAGGQLQAYAAAAVASALAAGGPSSTSAANSNHGSSSSSNNSSSGGGASGGGGTEGWTPARAAAAAASLSSSLGVPHGLVAQLLAASSTGPAAAGPAAAAAAAAAPPWLCGEALVSALEAHYMAAAAARAGGAPGAGPSGRGPPVELPPLLTLAAAATGTSLGGGGGSGGGAEGAPASGAGAAAGTGHGSGKHGTKKKKKKGGKSKKGGRYGSAAVLAAARAKADEGLAAALPLLGGGEGEGEGDLEPEEEEGEEGEGEGEGQPCEPLHWSPAATLTGRSAPASPRPPALEPLSTDLVQGASSVPASPSAASTHARQRVAAGRGAYVLDVARYVDHLHKEQRRMGGLLAATLSSAEVDEGAAPPPAAPTPAAAAAAAAGEAAVIQAQGGALLGAGVGGPTLTPRGPAVAAEEAAGMQQPSLWSMSARSAGSLQPPAAAALSPRGAVGRSAASSKSPTRSRVPGHGASSAVNGIRWEDQPHH